MSRLLSDRGRASGATRTLLPYVVLLVVELLSYSLSIGSPYWSNMTLQWTLFGTMAVAFNVVAGFAGRLAFGNTIFFGLAAYIVVVGDVHHWYPPLVGLAIAVPGCALLAYLLSYAFWRLNGLMFALVTFAMALIIQQLITLSVTFGQSAGLQEPLRVGTSIVQLSFSDPLDFVVVGLVIFFLAVALAHVIARSNWGPTLKAGRDDEIAATTAGINVSRNTALAWAVSAAVTAMAGVFYAQFNLFVEPVSSFGLVTVNSIVIPAIVGGLGYVWGPVVGSALVPVGLYLNNLSTGGGGLQSANTLLYGVVLVVVLRLWPGGLVSLRQAAWIRRSLPWLSRRESGSSARRSILTSAPPEAPATRVGGEEQPAARSGSARHRGDQAVLEVRDVRKRFGALHVLEGVDLQVHAGEVLGLIGPNGAGKSTLFNCITGVTRPDSGTVLLNGNQISGIAAHRVSARGIARTYQTPRLFDRLTALENVAAPAVRKAGRPGWEQAVAALEAVGLSQHADVRAGQLTLIERRMVELARAVVTEPDIVLLDEVMTGLEEHEAANVQDLIRRLQARGITFVIVEHVMGYLLPLTHRVAVLHRGTILASGSPNDVVRHPEVLEAYFGRLAAPAEDHRAPTTPGLVDARSDHAER